jgi:drug/metabolite transporter (DMT)-like permease
VCSSDLVFGSVIAFGCYMTLITRIGADRAAYALVINPIIALLLSTFFEGYTWTSAAAMGVILIVIGNVIVLAPLGNVTHPGKI